MCGRHELNETPARIGSRYRIDPGDLDFAQNADVRPTDTNPVILLREGHRLASMRRWGLVPFWAKDPKAISHPITARSEEAYEKPMFRGPFKGKRCPVPATTFFEWQPIEGQKKKQKIRIARADRDTVVYSLMLGATAASVTGRSRLPIDSKAHGKVRHDSPERIARG